MGKEKISSNTITRLDRGSLKRILKVSDLFAIGYGDLGSSIYYALGITAFYALGSTPLALGLAGIVFVCTALTYAEMTSTFHESGGSASFARHAFNDLISFIAGWGLLLDYIVTIAISAFAVGPYLSYFYTGLRVTSVQTGFTIGLIVILFVINLLGVRQSTRISLILAGFTILTQIIIILIGAGWLLDLSYIFDHLKINVPNVATSPTWSEFWKGTAMAMVAYTGIESIAQLSAEAKKPAQTVPKAISIAMIVLVFMYLGLSVVALSAIPPKDLAGKYLQDPIAGIIASLPFGTDLLAPWVGLLAATLLFVAANAGLIGASRLSFNMGEYYQLPRVFYKTHPKFKTPFIALGFFAILASLVVLWSRGKLSFLADLYNFGAMIAFFFAHLSLIVLRIKKPELERPYRIRFNIKIKGYSVPITAIIGCLATMSVWILVVITKEEGRYLGLSWMAFGILMYLFYRMKQKLPTTGQLSIEKIKMPDFKVSTIKHILAPIYGKGEFETLQAACEFAKMHHAALTVVHLSELPYSIPIDVDLKHGAIVEEALKRAEAVAAEYHQQINLKAALSREVSQSILEMLHEGNYDLLVLGLMKNGSKRNHQQLDSRTQKILKESPCRVWLCMH